MDLNEIAVFIKVVQLGSFSKAAAALGMPNSTVSARVSGLENRLGLTLIQRTTRKLAPTPAGQTYFDRCTAGLKEFEAAEIEVLSGRGEPHGRLRLTTPVELGNSVLPPLLTEFTRTYPRVTVEVILTDRTVDLIGEGVDLALRAGPLKDSSMVSRKIAEVAFKLFASPKYLRSVTTIDHPRAIENLSCLRFTALGDGPWSLTNGSERVNIVTTSRVLMNDLNLTKIMAIQGSGIALLPSFFCAAEVREKTLVTVLPQWRSQLAPLQFVYPAQKYVPAHVTAFTQMATLRIRDLLTTP